MAILKKLLKVDRAAFLSLLRCCWRARRRVVAANSGRLIWGDKGDDSMASVSV